MPPKKEPEAAKKTPQQEEPDTPPISKENLRAQILASYRNRSNDTSSFVEQLTQETQEAMMQRVTLQAPFNVREGFLEKSTTTWVDKIFDHFQSYIFEFNPQVARSELEVSCDRPTVTREVISYNAWKEPEKTAMLFKGWLSTRSWTMLVRGTKDKIEAFIVPGDRVIGLTRTQTTYKPLLALDSYWDKGKVSWKRDGQPVVMEDLEAITKDLFASLIKFSRGEKTERDVLAITEAPLPPPETKVFDSDGDFFSAFESEASRKRNNDWESPPPQSLDETLADEDFLPGGPKPGSRAPKSEMSASSPPPMTMPEEPRETQTRSSAKNKVFQPRTPIEKQTRLDNAPPPMHQPPPPDIEEKIAALEAKIAKSPPPPKNPPPPEPARFEPSADYPPPSGPPGGVDLRTEAVTFAEIAGLDLMGPPSSAPVDGTPAGDAPPEEVEEAKPSPRAKESAAKSAAREQAKSEESIPDAEPEEKPNRIKQLLDPPAGVDLFAAASSEVSAKKKSDPLDWFGVSAGQDASKSQKTEESQKKIPDEPTEEVSDATLQMPGKESPRPPLAAVTGGARPIIDIELDKKPELKEEPKAEPKAQPKPEPEREPENKVNPEMIEATEMNVSLACDILQKSVEKELQEVAKLGAEAFSSQDMERAERALKRATKLKAFREKVNTLLTEWRSASEG